MAAAVHDAARLALLKPVPVATYRQPPLRIVDAE